MQRTQSPKGKKREESKEFVPLKIFSSRGFLKDLPKPMSAQKLAEGLISRHGYENALRIAESGARDTFGSAPHTSPNPHKTYYTNVVFHVKQNDPKKAK